jgi:hypothetical protein
VAIAAIIGKDGKLPPTPFFFGAAGFYAFCIVLNWWCYARKAAEKPC